MAPIEGRHYVKCHDGCGRRIAFEVWDEGYPQKIQPSGFLCSCNEWTANECGNSEPRCDNCTAYDRAEELTAIARSIMHHLRSGDVYRAKTAAAGIDVVVRDVQSRIHSLRNRRTGCDANCEECRVGAA